MTWPYWTDFELKIHGLFKSQPEDFVVEEIPLYSPCGKGEHLYLFIEKTDISTDQLLSLLMRSLGISIKQIGYAGKKDKVGITRQWISLSNVQKSTAEKLEISGVNILKTESHKNKLRLGHLKGNRFQIVIRDVPEGSEKIVNAILTKLAKFGVPNYFGPQRFGLQSDNAIIGAAILQNNWRDVYSRILGITPKIEESSDPNSSNIIFSPDSLTHIANSRSSQNTYYQSAARHLMCSDGILMGNNRNLPKHLTRFYLNALQSFWFNESLSCRLPEMNKIWQGDLAYLHRNGAVFKVEDKLNEQQRADKFEISPSGPLWGYKMTLPIGVELQLEKEVLKQSGLDPDLLCMVARKFKLEGQRRSYRIPLENYSCKQISSELHVQFDLPGGSYATSVVREMMKDHFPEQEISKPSFDSKSLEIS